MNGKMWDHTPEFDQAKDKSQFRDYDAACGRVKAFYKEQHGSFRFWSVFWVEPSDI